MIVEFLGLPGAGKSSLEAALGHLLALAGLNVVDRRQRVEQLVFECSGLPRNRNTFVRRASTARYKFQLISDCLMGPERFLRARDLLSQHRMRAVIRVAEDVRLYRADHTSARQPHCLKLSEGLSQHVAALGVWRSLLGSSPVSHDATSLLRQASHGRRVLVVHVSVPEAVALDRLLARGRPALWPRTCEPAAIISAFNSHIAQVLAAFECLPNVSILRIDGALAARDWASEAAYVFATIQNVVDTEKNEGPLRCV